MRWAAALGIGAVALMALSCGSEQATAPTSSSAADDSTPALPDTEVTAPTSTTIPATTSSRPQDTEPVSPPTTDAAPATVDPSDGTGTTLAEILEPHEARALVNSMFTSYSFSCWPYSGPQGTTWIDWSGDEFDRNARVSRGVVLSCLPRTEPPADRGTMDLIVLDDNGTISWWWVGSDAVSHVPAAPGGLLCRDYMATENFSDAMEWVGASPPWNDDALAYQWALAYWFLDGQPNRMDADRNGVPCELLFDQEVVAEVWAGDNP